jgi:hypothetical protein
MAEVKFYANDVNIAATGEPTLIQHSAGSGMGMYGAGYGISVPVGQHQDTSYVTNANGTASGIKLNNTKYMSVSGCSHNGGAEIDNESMPNYYAPIRIRFAHTEAVRVQNCKMRIFDRNDITQHASGVNTKVYEIRNLGATADSGNALAHRGEASHAWQEFDPVEDMFDVTFTSSPGVSGTNGTVSDSAKDGVLTTDGAAHESLEHDWYAAISCTPDEIGSKVNYGLWFSLEYL